MLAENNHINLIEILPPDAQAEVDKCGYEFLASMGYKVAGCDTSGKKRRKLRSAIRADKRSFVYKTVRENGSAVIFFALLDDKGDVIGKSKGLRFKVFEGEKTS